MCRIYRAEGFDVHFQEADAEALPFPDGSFDVALSAFGAMFTPEHVKAAHEMKRVVRSGGRIGMANWTPEGFIGQLFRVIGAHVAPPAGTHSPVLWGSEPRIVELFSQEATDLAANDASSTFSLPLCRALDRGVPLLLRTDAQGLRSA